MFSWLDRLLRPFAPRSSSLSAKAAGSFIRVINSQAGWLDARGEPDALAEKVFGDGATGVSVYLCLSHTDEVSALAALQLTRGDSLTKAVWAVRIHESELSAASVRIAPTTGNTGVHRVDALHRDLHATNESFVQLTRTLLRAQRSGEDRVRQVKQAVLELRLRGFAELPKAEISDPARRRCQRILSALA